VLASISERKAQTELTVVKLKREISQNREHVDSVLNSISGEVRSNIQVWDSQIQSVKHANDSKIMKINNTISSLEANITAGVANNNMRAIQQTDVVKATAVDQTESIEGTVRSDTIGQGVNGTNACNMSIYSDSANIPIPSVSSCNDNVNAGSGLYANNTDLNEITLPIFTDSTSQVPLHFIRDLDLYFTLKKTPEELRSTLVLRAVKEPFVKQWLLSAFDKMKKYDEFKKAFAELLRCPSRQASIPSAIHLDKHDPGSVESCLDHYMRYANMTST
jgi:hypothetical protein